MLGYNFSSWIIGDKTGLHSDDLDILPFQLIQLNLAWVHTRRIYPHVTCGKRVEAAEQFQKSRFVFQCPHVSVALFGLGMVQFEHMDALVCL